jgi:hypothetical protein
MEGVEPTHCCQYQILSLARLPIPPHRHVNRNEKLARFFAAASAFMRSSVAPHGQHGPSKRTWTEWTSPFQFNLIHSCLLKPDATSAPGKTKVCRGRRF